MNAAVQFGSASSLQAQATAPPPAGEGAERNAAWWNGLSADQQQAYLQAQPAAIGALDGLPAEVRHEANLAVLREDAAGGHDRDSARALLERIENSHNGPETERIHLLGYTPPGPGNSPDARVVASIGNPDTADNVAVYVPGTGTDLSNIGGSIDRMDDLRAQAELVPNSGTTSTIVWLGYDAPDNLLQATQGGYARDGAPDLRDFTEGLAEARQHPDGRTTVIGHSYGSTVVGTADAMAGRGLAADDIVAMGSPGMGYEAPERQGWFDGPMVDNVGDMHIDAEHFWAGAAANDPVTYTEVHGNSPVDWSFGGQRIGTDGASGHSEYWDPGTEALRNQAYIVTGRYDQVDTVRRRFG
ncbi:alpha/beta hydrolase [Luteimonas huabeiensis]|uniref:alpha/beta hydrolase n=1 Tax=Luteimonas huabeiensis TaxID=1244513 RepID=UPI000464D567|nr:alpha/beta hydrolase [Luteimonas huabeiensis]